MSLKERFDQLAERERKLLTIFGGVVGVMLILVIPFFVSSSVSSQRELNDSYKEAIQSILDERPLLVQRQEEAARIDARYAKRAPALAGFLASMASKTGVEIPETQDRATIPHGKTFKERQTRIKLSKVSMLPLSNFLEAIAQSGHPVTISRMDLQKRGSKDDEFDVELDISAFDREEVKKPVKPAADSEGEVKP